MKVFLPFEMRYSWKILRDKLIIFKIHNSEILTVQLMRVGRKCSYLIKYKKLESPIVCNPVNRRGDFEE
jgi:hypothetical protein